MSSWRNDNFNRPLPDMGSRNRYHFTNGERQVIATYRRTGRLGATGLGELGRDPISNPDWVVGRYISSQQSLMESASELWFHASLFPDIEHCIDGCNMDEGVCRRHSWWWLGHLEYCACDLTDWDMR